MGLLNIVGDRVVDIHRIRRLFKSRSSQAFCYPYEVRESSLFKQFEQRSDAKAFVVGMPKAGNNWLMGILSTYMDLDVIPATERNAKGIFHTHDSFSSNLYFRPDIYYGVYIMRDLRDIVCSFFHYVNRKPGIAGLPLEVENAFDDIESFYFQSFLPRLVAQYDIYGHVDSYMKRGLAMVKYEDLSEDPMKSLRFVLRYWNVDIDEDKMRQAINSNDFKVTKLKGRQEKGHNLSPEHMRKGQVGSYKEELPDTVLMDIERRFGDLLLRYGYKLEHYK